MAEIQDINISWEGHSGADVEAWLRERISKRFGYFSTEQDTEAGILTVNCFDSHASYAEWVASPEENEHLLLQTLTIPIPSTGDGMSTIVDLTAKTNRKQLITTDDTVKLMLRFTSYTYNSATGEKRDTDETCTIVVQKRANANMAWQTAGEVKGVPSVAFADEQSYIEVDISKYIDKGTSQVRVQAVGEESGKATPSILFSEVIKTNLALTFANDWEKPVTDKTKSRLSYYIEGAVDKTLKVVLDDSTEELVFPIGKSTHTQTAWETDITEEAFLTNGLHRIKAWIEVPMQMDDGTTQIIKGEESHAQILHVYEDYNLGTQVILNNVATEATNWVDLDFFDYAIYKPRATSAPIEFTLYSFDRKVQYAQFYAEAVATETKHTYRSTMEVDEDDVEFSAAMVVSSEGQELTSYFIQVDNTMNFAPTKGADFVLNPKLHSNTGNSAKIYNDATGEQVAATFKNFGFANDGYTTDDKGVRCLRVLAGSTLDISYEAFTDFLGNSNTKSLTIEIDFATRNITNEDDAILKMCSYLASDGNPIGWEMRPLEACYMTNKLRYRKDQDIMWQEGVRTRVAVNIVYNLGNRGLNYIRLFVNGVINREMSYDVNDTFVFNGTSGGIQIGQSGADIDIYGIRVYKKALSSADVMQDYKASLATTEEKKRFQEANDILGDDATIAYAKVFGKYNTLLWKFNDRAPRTQLATYGNTKDDTYQGDLVINKVGDEKRSGTYRHMTTKGQGTSSMSYWKWNQRFQPEDDSIFVNNLGEETKGYQLEEGMPFATRLDGKINWASSMQSHKMGSVALYQDVWNQLVKDGVLDGNTLTKQSGGQSFTQTEDGYKDCRVCVKQDWFMMFVQETEGATPVFYGIYTWGPGKGDKPTFGYNKTDFPDFTVLEGCDNGKPLVMHRVPWDNYITGSKDDEVWKYAGEDNWEISMGSGNLWPYYKEAFNMVYLHHTDIHYFTGTFEELKKSAPKDYPTEHDYWVTNGSSTANRYDLFRYDQQEKQWVKAGINRSTLNLSSQLGITPSGTVWTDINKAFIEERRRLFKEKVGGHYDVKDACFTMAFLKLFGATDNWGKNTYLYMIILGDLIRFMQDDLDTIKLIDNVGRKTKPYYLEEHDKDENGEYFCPSERNAFYNLIEQCFPDLIRSMEKSILQAISKFGGGDFMKGLQRYYYDIQEQIPAVAYNEIARLLYEDAAVALADGRYKNNTPPLPQCLGDQLQAERQWDKLRFVYLSSYAGYGMFDQGEVSGALSFRSIGTNPQYSFTITPHIWLYPAYGSGDSAIYSYTRVRAGEPYTNVAFSPSSNANVRICGIDYIRDIGDFSKHNVGEALNLSGARLTKFVAAYPANVADEDKAFRISSISENIAAPNMEEVNLSNVSSLRGNLNLSKQIRLKRLVLAGTSLTSVTLPKTEMLTSVSLPTTLTELTIDGQTQLASVSIASVKSIATLKIVNAPKFDSFAFIRDRFVESVNSLSSVEMEVNWTSCTTAVLKYLLSLPTCRLRGTIKMASGQNINFVMKQKLVAKFGNVDDKDNDLYIEYSVVNLEGCDILGPEGLEIMMDEDFEPTPDIDGNPYAKTYQFTLANPLPSNNANDIIGVEWSVEDDGTYATINPTNGLLTIVRFPEKGEKLITGINAKVYTKKTPSGFDAERLSFRLYYRQAEVGDYVYNDGTFSAKQNPNKTVIGRCYYVEELEDGYVDRRMIYDVNLYTGHGNRNYAMRISIYNGAYNTDTYVDEALTGSHGISGQPQSWQYVNTTNPLADIFVNGQDPTDGWVIVRQDQYFSHGIKASDSDGTYTLTDGDSPNDDKHINSIDYFRGILALSEGRVGERIPMARFNFLRYIYKRNYILNAPELQDMPFGVPTESSTETEWQNVTTMLNAAVGQYADYKTLLFPGFSYIYAYEPNVKVPKKFKKHMWYAPSIGDCVRIWYMTQASVRGVWPSSTYDGGGQSISMSSAASLQSLSISPLPWGYDRDNFACCAF